MTKTKTLISLAAVVVAVVATVALVGSGGGSQAIDTTAMARQIEPGLREQLADRDIALGRIDCVVKSQTEAECVAKVRDAEGGTRATLPIHVDVDPSGGKLIWKVAQS